MLLVSLCVISIGLKGTSCGGDRPSARFPLNIQTNAHLRDTREGLRGNERWEYKPWQQDTWQRHHTHTKTYINFLSQSNRKPKSLIMPKERLRVARNAISPLSCERNDCLENVTLSRSLWSRLGRQLINYIQPDVIALVQVDGERDSCIRMGQSLYKMNIPAFCTNLSQFYGYHSNVLVLASGKDDGWSISSVMLTIAERVTNNELALGPILVFLPSSRTVLYPPHYKFNYCIVQAKGTGVELKEVFTFGPESPGPAEEVVGWWTPNNEESSYIPLRSNLAIPNDFKGNVVRVVTLENRPYSSIEKTPEGELIIDGYISELCKLFAKKLNFTIEWKTPADGEFGVPLADGNFTGTVGVLQRKEAEIAAVPLNINVPRAEVIDFSPPVDYTYCKLVIYKYLEKQDIDWNTYFSAFHWSVWLCVMGVWITMAVGLVIVAHGDMDVTLYNYLFAFIGALAQQGSSIEPQSGRGRIVFFSFWVGSVIIYTSYTASLTSKLAVVYKVDPFENLRDALTTAGYSVAIQKGTAYYTMVEGMARKDHTMKLFYDQLEAKQYLKVPGNEEGLALVQSIKGKYAYLQDTTTLLNKIKGNCSFEMLGPQYFPDYVSMGLAKNLSYANILSEIVVKAADSGIAGRLLEKWLGQPPPCDSEEFKKIGFTKTVSALTLLAVGMVLGVSILLAERWCSLCWFLYEMPKRNRKREAIAVDSKNAFSTQAYHTQYET